MLIRTKKLTKTFGDQLVIDHLDLEVEEGMLIAYIGTNGAGKSTTMRMLTGLLAPTSGEIELAPDLKIGMVFQESVLDAELTVLDNLRSRLALYRNRDKDWMDKLIRLTRIDAFLNQTYGTLSGGQRRRVDIVRALLNKPNLLFLQKNMQDSWSGTPHLEEVLDNWVIGGTLAITSITTTWTGIVRLVHDRENHKLEDFLLTDTSRFKVYLGYLMSASIIGFTMQAFMFVVMKLYFHWQDKISLSASHLPQILGIMVLGSLLGASLALLILQFVKSIESSEALSTIVGTVSGFLVGVYMPLGALPNIAQIVVKITPAAYVAAAYRQVLINQDYLGKSEKAYLGIGLKLKELTTVNQELLIISGVLVINLSVLAMMLIVKEKRPVISG